MTHTRNDGNEAAKNLARTPMPLFIQLDAEFMFDLDAAASPNNALCPGYYTIDDDAFEQPWYEDYGDYGGAKSVFCNPPYSNGQIKDWCLKAYEESIKGATVVMLIQSDTSTEYHKFCHEFAEEIRYLKPRVKFNNPDGTPMKGSPQVGSMVVVFREHVGKCKTSVWEWKK